MTSRYVYSLGSRAPDNQSKGGIRRKVDKSLFPILEGMSLYLLELEPMGIREPHWHVNAHEFCYCISGKVKMSLFAGGTNRDTFTLEPGEVAFIPQGYIHYLENIGDTKATLVIGFNHERPEEFSISTVFSAAGPQAMAATFNVEPTALNLIPEQSKDIVIAQRTQKTTAKTIKAGAHKFKLRGIDPQVDVLGGTIALCHKDNFPILKGITLYDLRLNVGGLREPHWHPNAAELDYVVSGKARMLIMSPDGVKNVFEVGKGDVVYIPAAYYHYIENIGDENLHFAVFFNHESPEDIGISGSMGAFTPEIMAAVLKADKEVVSPFCRYGEDVFIAPRLMPGIRG